MIIVDPVTLGDVACTRASPKWAFDRTGTLVQVPVDTLAVTYDPSDLSAAPRPLYELAATNWLAYSEAFDLWQKSPVITVQANALAAPNGTLTADLVTNTTGDDYTSAANGITSVSGQVYTTSLFAKAGSSSTLTVRPITGTNDGFVDFNLATGTIMSSGIGVAGSAAPSGTITPVGGGWFRLTVTIAAQGAVFTTYVYPRTLYPSGAPGGVYLWGAQTETGSTATSYIPTTTAPVTRAADTIAPGAGVVFSNVPITETPYNSGTTYAANALVYDPATHNAFQSLTAGNVGKALTDTTAWTPRGAINRRAMLDQYNNTQTTNPDEILMVVSPQAISQGLFIGNAYGDEVRISVVDLTEGLVYSETQTLIESNSGSSPFNWCFKRIKRRDYFLTLKLPPYANALITISLRKVGGIAKCGMCAVGPVDDFGPTLMGLSTEGKDYSSTTFNFDGTSSTIIRPYAKRMTCDVMVDNDQIDYLQARLFEIRQKPIVWVGGPYGSTAVYGRYESFKNVIQYATRSLMNLTIGGAV